MLRGSSSGLEEAEAKFFVLQVNAENNKGLKTKKELSLENDDLLLLLLQALPRCNTVVVEMLHTVTHLQSLFQRRAEK